MIFFCPASHKTNVTLQTYCYHKMTSKHFDCTYLTVSLTPISPLYYPKSCSCSFSFLQYFCNFHLAPPTLSLSLFLLAFYLRTLLSTDHHTKPIRVSFSGGRMEGRRRISLSRAMTDVELNSSSSEFLQEIFGEYTPGIPTGFKTVYPVPAFTNNGSIAGDLTPSTDDLENNRNFVADQKISPALTTIARTTLPVLKSKQIHGELKNMEDVTAISGLHKTNSTAISKNIPQVPKIAGFPPLKTQVIILTTKRSGSSFVGELFNSNRKVFYMFEPLFEITFDVLKHRFTNSKAKVLTYNIWNHTLRCNYTFPSDNYWMRQPCSHSNAIKECDILCPSVRVPKKETGRVISGICDKHPFAVLKTIRIMDIEELRTFLEDQTLNLKILHLVRDPRAVMNSRRRLHEPNSDLIRRKGKKADEVKDLCEHMARNLDYRDSPPEWLKGKYMLVRFEDVAENPIEVTRRIYQNLGLEYTEDVTRWIDKNTHGTDQTKKGKVSAFSRTRDTKKVLNAWRATISKSLMHEIESKCKDVMKRLSYETEIL